MTVSLPRVRLLQRTLLPCIQTVRIAHGFAVAESMLAVKQQGVVYIERFFSDMEDFEQKL